MINILFYMLRNAVELSLSAGIVIILQRTILKKNPSIAKALWIVFLVRAFCPVELYTFKLKMKPQAVSVEQAHAGEGGIGIFWVMLPIIWICVAAVAYIISIFKYKRLCHDVKHLSCNENNVYLCKADKLAFTCGLFKSKIVISDDLSEDRYIHVFNHESQHAAAKDNLIKYLYLIVCCMYWFSPILWIGRKYLDYVIELCCDSKATRGYTRADIQEYVKCMSFMSGCDLDKLMTETAFSKEHSETYNRIEYLLTDNESGVARKFFGWLLAGLVIVAMFVGIEFIPVHAAVIDGVEYIYEQEAKVKIINIEDGSKPAIGYNDDGTVAWIWGTHLE